MVQCGGKWDWIFGDKANLVTFYITILPEQCLYHSTLACEICIDDVCVSASGGGRWGQLNSWPQYFISFIYFQSYISATFMKIYKKMILNYTKQGLISHPPNSRPSSTTNMCQRYLARVWFLILIFFYFRTHFKSHIYEIHNYYIRVSKRTQYKEIDVYPCSCKLCARLSGAEVWPRPPPGCRGFLYYYF